MSNLSTLAAEAAVNAVCTRCGALMIQPRGIPRLTTGTYRRVGGRGVEHFSLCSGCSRAFRLFLAGYGV